MVVPPTERRGGRAAGAAALAVLLAGLAVLLEPPGRRGAAALLVAAGLVVGALLGTRLPARGRRTVMERFNDAAFLTVVAAASLLVVRLARPWTAAVPGLVGGALVGRALRPARPTPGEPDGG
jgi:hypothetical protein